MKLGRIFGLAATSVLLGGAAMAAPQSAFAQHANACVTSGAVRDAVNTGLASDCEALLEARDALAGTGSLNWAEDIPITDWDGITLRGTPLRVAWLNIREGGLDGTVPAALGRLSNLTYLNLRNNGLTGPIPPELDSLTNLKYLGLNNNVLTGPIPDLSGMTYLEHLYLSNNDLSGGLADWLGTLTKLRDLWLWGNELEGTIPDLRGMTSLDRVKLQNNQFTGGIPAWFGEMTNLRYLYLHYNALGGEIPLELGGMTDLRYLWLHNGQLTGSIPSELGGLTNLWDLNLHSNSLEGGIPPELGDMTNLQRIRLHRNMLSGEIPDTLGALESLRFMWLHGNMLSGEIPSELGRLTNLERLWLSENSLTGEIPEELGDLSDHSLVQWRLADNQFTGCVPRGLQDVADTDFDLLDLPLCDSSPDLVVELAPVSVDSLEPRERFTLDLTVRNQGGGPSNSTTLRYYLRSIDTTVSIQVGTDSVGSLGPSGSRDYLLTLTAPSSDGIYYYHVCIDPVPGESDMQNNCSNVARITVGQTSTIDIVVDSVSVSDSRLEPGEGFTLYATARNQGDGSSDSTTLRYYRSADSNISTRDTEVGTDSVGSLGPSSSRDYSIALTAPSSAGTYYYGACVDPVPGESDTRNNCSNVARITVGQTSTIDIVVDSVSASDSSLEPGEGFTLYATARNQGDGSSDSTTLRYLRSRNSDISTSDTEVGTDHVGSLRAGNSSDESISLTAPSSAGTYYYGACVDPVPGESDTRNNCSNAVTLTVRVTSIIEIVVDSVSASDSSLEPGEGFTLYATVRNRGNASSDSTTLRYLRSRNSDISTSDTEVGTDHVGSLRAGNSSDESISLTAPSSAGTYYYGACVDPVPGESDTRNNCSNAVTLTVRPTPRPTPGPSPDLVASVVAPLHDEVLFDGGPFVLRVRVTNQGDGPSSLFNLLYLLSDDSTISTGDTVVRSAISAAFRAGDSREKSVSLTAPPIGLYYYGVCVLPVEGESDTGNNCSQGRRVQVFAPAYVELETVKCENVWFGTRTRISGTVGANTNLENVTVIGYVIDHFDQRSRLGTDNLGRMSTRERKDFSITGLRTLYTSCDYSLEWEY